MIQNVLNGVFDLTLENWDMGNIKWDVVFKQDNVTKRIPLHPDFYNEAIVDNHCSFTVISFLGVDTAILNKII